MKRLILLFLIFCVDVTVGQAETLKLMTYYPSPYGIYDRLRLVPHADLPSPCLVGTFYVNEKGSLQYCHPSQNKGEWSAINTRMERGTIEVSNKEPSAITFHNPFSDLPLIQIYGEETINTKEGPQKTVVNVTSSVAIFDVSSTGFKISFLGDDDKKTFNWVALGN